MLLDNKLNSPYEFVSSMVKNMKERFDNYWGEFVRDNIRKVQKNLYELYDEYVSLYHLPTMEQHCENGIENTSHVNKEKNTSTLFDLINKVAYIEVVTNVEKK
ncbi:hypothetical protein GQ457_05G015610 [Hibiscus cannabinus]